MLDALIMAACFGGGYALSTYTWNPVHTWFIGAQAKLIQVLAHARELEAAIRAKL